MPTGRRPSLKSFLKVRPTDCIGWLPAGKCRRLDPSWQALAIAQSAGAALSALVMAMKASGPAAVSTCNREHDEPSW